jgi:hypothetical protein
MKSLQTYSNDILSGKMLIEKLVLTRHNISKYEQIEIPLINSETCEVITDISFKTLNLPIDHEYFLYLDKYRVNVPHLGSKEDFIFNVIHNQYDYEDFDESKDILYSSKNLKDVVAWYFKKHLKIDVPKNNEDYEDWRDRVNADNIMGKIKIHDSLNILYDFYVGNDDYSCDLECFSDYSDLNELATAFGSNMGYDVISSSDPNFIDPRE